MNKQSEIDFVITWVNSQDKNWQNEKACYETNEGTDAGEERYRDWELLRYWFRGVEKYASWVRKIHLITSGKVPDWLKEEHPKLHIVRHEDYIPQEYLPTFNSHVLEIYLHKIKGLSEQFVYFNDDVFLTNTIEPTYFFKEGKPCDMLAFQPVVANPKNPVMSHVLLNNSLVLCKYFDKRKNIKEHPGNYYNLKYPPLYFVYNVLEQFFPLFTGFYSVHGAMPFCKSTFEQVWQVEEEYLLQMSAHKFRSKEDLTPYLFREWQKLSNHFVPTNILKSFAYFEVGNDLDKLKDAITRQKKKVICINDAPVGEAYTEIKKDLQWMFQQILPEGSSFER